MQHETGFIMADLIGREKMQMDSTAETDMFEIHHFQDFTQQINRLTLTAAPLCI